MVEYSSNAVHNRNFEIVLSIETQNIRENQCSWFPQSLDRISITLSCTRGGPLARQHTRDSKLEGLQQEHTIENKWSSRSVSS